MNNARQNWNCPPLMSDGRHITDYRPSCEVHCAIQNKYRVHNAYDLRLLMQRQAEHFRRQDRMFLDARNSCVSCTPFSVDPNRNASYWWLYRQKLGF